MSMKISGEFPNINKIMNKNKGINKYEKSSGTNLVGKDNVSISNKGKDFHVVMKALKEVPTLREDKIAEIEEKMKSGTYTVSGKDIVSKMVQSSMDKKIDM